MATAVAVVSTVATFAGGSLAGAIITGAVAGAVVGGATAVITGGDVFEGALKGAVVGGVTAGIGYGLSSASAAAGTSAAAPTAAAGIGGEAGIKSMIAPLGTKTAGESIKVSGAAQGAGAGIGGGVPAGGGVAGGGSGVVGGGGGMTAEKALIYSGIGGGAAQAIGNVGTALLAPNTAEEARKAEEKLRAQNLPGRFTADVAKITVPGWWDKYIETNANIEGYKKPLNKGLLGGTA